LTPLRLRDRESGIFSELFPTLKNLGCKPTGMRRLGLIFITFFYNFFSLSLKGRWLDSMHSIVWSGC